MVTEGAKPKRVERKRLKGLDWKGWIIVNPDKPLGRAWPGRVARTIPIVLMRSDRGGLHVDEDVLRLELALELNARLIGAFVLALRSDVLPIHLEEALQAIPDFCEQQYECAVRKMTAIPTTEAHAAHMDAAVKRVRRYDRVQELARLCRVQTGLVRGLEAARLTHERAARFIRDNVDNNRKPGEATLLKTFLAFSLVDRLMESVSTIKQLLQMRAALRSASDITYDEMLHIAFHGHVNAADLYLDYHYLEDLFELAIYAGRWALGIQEPMKPDDQDVFRTMLCGIGEDRETAPELRTLRAEMAVALRTVWRRIPGLEATTRCYGCLASA